LHSAPPRAAPSAERPSDDVLARFDGGQISVADLSAAIANKDPNTRRRLATSAGKLAFLRELETYELLVLEAKRRGYERHSVVIDAKRSAAVAAMLASELSVAPASIPASDVARELAARSPLTEKPAPKQRRPAVDRALREELAKQRFDQARTELLKRLHEKHRPEIHGELIDRVTQGPVLRDQPDGFPAAPPDPRAASIIVESDGV